VKDAQQGSQAVERALAIFELFDEGHERLTIAEVAAALDVHRTTASRLLSALERHRLVELDEPTGTYVLGLGLVSLAGHVLNRFPVRDSGHAIIRDLRDQTAETAYLGVLDGDQVVYIDQASSPHVRTNIDWVGRSHPLTAGVTGALLLAFQAPEVIGELLREARSDDAATAEHLSAAELQRAREQGHLARYKDPLSDQAVVAAPIRDRRGEVVAAVCLSAPRHRVDEQRFLHNLIPATLRAAAGISEGLGFAR
jgi:DNA-binding IclR family transcriptional regulator